MTPYRTESLIANGETLSVEFKREANDLEIVETVVCLANGGGGTLLIGVEDDGTVRGALPRHGEVTDPRRVEALISNRTRPALGVQAEVEDVKGLLVLIVRVPSVSIPTATASGRY